MKYLDLWVCTIIAAPSHLPLTLSAQRKVRLDMLCVCVRAHLEWLGAEIFYYLEIITHTHSTHINMHELFIAAYFCPVCTHIIIKIKWLIGENHRWIDHRLEWMDISERGWNKTTKPTGVMNSCVELLLLRPLLLLWSLPWSLFCRYENRICW